MCSCTLNLNMDWTNDKIIDFIQAIELCPVLWDTEHLDYKNKNKKHDTIHELAQQFNCDSNEVMRKWKIILAQNRREKRKIAYSKSSASGIINIYKPKWFAYPYLTFIQGRDDSNASINIQWETNEQLSQDIDQQPEQDAEETPQEKLSEILKPPYKLKRRRVDDEDPRISHALSMVENINKHVESSKQDDDDIFGAAVAMKLRQFKDQRTKILVQRDIDMLLYDALIGNGKYSTALIPSPYSESSSTTAEEFVIKTEEFDIND